MTYLRLQPMLATVRSLIDGLNAGGIRYCHWKSNVALARSLTGATDIDLLVHRGDAVAFRTLLGQLTFKPAVMTDGEAYPSVEHYYALDAASGMLVHVHAYYRVITGESLAKNYRLPIEEMLLQNTRAAGSVCVPTRGAELIVFTLRMMLKHTSMMEIGLLARYRKETQQEIAWLLEPGALDEAVDLVEDWLPALDPDLFLACVAALRQPASLAQRMWLAQQMRLQLRPYARHSLIRAWFTELQKFSALLLRRLTRPRKGMVPRSGGAVIAFVGSEATGKSTLLAEICAWLGEHFSVTQIHAGKPAPTLLTAVPNALVPLLRAAFPSRRSTVVEAQVVAEPRPDHAATTYPLIFGIRSTLLAYDRWSLLTRAYGRSANGHIVLSDRYPSSQGGAPDSPQLAHLPVPPGGGVRTWLARAEARLYRRIPPPDLVIYLSAPLEVTVARNAARGKREPEDYVRRRHARSANLDFGQASVYRINTDQPFEQTVHEVKQAIWNAI